MNIDINTIVNCDCIEGLKQMPDCSVNCCVTSPPYFGLRSYLPNGVKLKPNVPQSVKDELKRRGILPIDHITE